MERHSYSTAVPVTVVTPMPAAAMSVSVISAAAMHLNIISTCKLYLNILNRPNIIGGTIVGPHCAHYTMWSLHTHCAHYTHALRSHSWYTICYVYNWSATQLGYHTHTPTHMYTYTYTDTHTYTQA